MSAPTPAIRADDCMMEIDATIDSLANTLNNSKNRQTDEDFEAKLVLMKLKRQKVQALAVAARTQVLLAELDFLVAAKELKLELRELMARQSKHKGSGHRSSSTQTSSKRSSESDKRHSPSKKLLKENGKKSPLHTLNRHSTKITKTTNTKCSNSKSQSASHKCQENQETIGKNQHTSKDKNKYTERVQDMMNKLFGEEEEKYKKSKSTDICNKVNIYRCQEVIQEISPKSNEEAQELNTKEAEKQDIIDAIHKHRKAIANTQKSNHNQKNTAGNSICLVFDSPKTTTNTQIQYNNVDTTKPDKKKIVNANTQLKVKINRTSLDKATNDRIDTVENIEQNNHTNRHHEQSKQQKEKTHYEQPKDQNENTKQNNENYKPEQKHIDDRYSTVKYLQQVNQILREQNKLCDLDYEPPKRIKTENRSIPDINDISRQHAIYNEILRQKPLKRERSHSLTSVDTTIFCVKCGHLGENHDCPCP